MTLDPRPSDAELLARAQRRHWEWEKPAGRIVVVDADPSQGARDEKAIQRAVAKLFRAFGCTVYNLSQARASKQTPGLGDLFVFAPSPILASFWFETKTATGKLSPTQEEFRELCLRTCTGHVVGGLSAAEDKLIALGIAQRAPDGTLEKT